MRKVGGEHPFCVLIYMNSHMFHICFILFILLSYLIFDFVCLTLSSADTHFFLNKTSKVDLVWTDFGEFFNFRIFIKE